MPHEVIHPETLSDNANFLSKLVNARRAHNYKLVFMDDDGTPSLAGQKMLADLNRFCRGNKSTYDPDPRAHALLEGRREVLLRILNFIGIPSHELNQYVENIDE